MTAASVLFTSCASESAAFRAISIAGSFLDDTLPEISRPVPIMAGGKDPLITPQDLAAFGRLIPHAQIFLFPDRPRLFHQEIPAEVARLITAVAK